MLHCHIITNNQDRTLREDSAYTIEYDFDIAQIDSTRELIGYEQLPSSESLNHYI